MRRWLLLLLLFVLPVQFAFAGSAHRHRSFAAIGSPAQPVAEAKNFDRLGFGSAAMVADDASPLSSDLGSLHCECSGCHLSGMLPAAAHEPRCTIARQWPAPEPRAAPASEPPDSIDRPNWHRAG